MTCAITSEEVVYTDAAASVLCATTMSWCRPVDVFLDGSAESSNDEDSASDASQMAFGWLSVVSPLLLTFLS